MAVCDTAADAHGEDDQSGDGGPAEAARFVSESLADLSLLAQRHRLSVLAHLLEMARMEADDAALRIRKFDR